MDISKIPVGQNPPSDVNAIIEIPQGGVPIKYELDKASGTLFVEPSRAGRWSGCRASLATSARTRSKTADPKGESTGDESVQGDSEVGPENL